MLSNSLELDSDIYHSVTQSGAEEFEHFCPANVGPSDQSYLPCGKKMRKYKSGKTVCPLHGEMH